MCPLDWGPSRDEGGLLGPGEATDGKELRHHSVEAVVRLAVPRLLLLGVAGQQLAGFQGLLMQDKM